jgi:uncharacterized protein YjiS (DUF1127 family)
MLRLLSLIIAWPFQVVESRRALRLLAGMDARDLADIGLTPQDLRDATATPLFADPTLALARRAAEREALARRARRPLPEAPRIAAE